MNLSNRYIQVNISLFSLAFALYFFSNIVMAQQLYYDSLLSKCPAVNGPLATRKSDVSCDSSCHNSSRQLNSVGADFKANGYTVTAFSSPTLCSLTNTAHPVLASISSQQVLAGNFFSLNLSATDTDSTNLTFTATGLPSGLGVNDDGVGKTASIQGVTTLLGTYNVTVTVTDHGGWIDSKSFTLTVAAPPVLALIGNKTATQGVFFNLNLSATDNDSANLVFTASGLPAGLSLTDDGQGKTAVISGTPTIYGSFQVTVTVKDSLLNADEETFILNIAAPPVLALIGNKTATQGVFFNLNLSATDNDSANLVFTASGLPAGLSLTDDGQGKTAVISGTPTTRGSYQVTVNVSDGVLKDSKIFTLNVVAFNATPVLDTINNQAAVVGVPFTLNLSATDDGADLTFSAENLPPGLSLVDDGLGKTAVISGTITSIGENIVNVIVSDGSLSDNQTFTLKKLAAPVLSPLADQSGQQAVPFNLTISVTDLDSGSVHFSITGLPPGLESIDNGSYSTTIRGVPLVSGIFPINVTVTDDVGLSNSQAFNLSLAAASPNAPAVLDPIGDRVFPINSSVLFTIHATDPNGDSLSFSELGLSAAGLTLIDNGDGTATVTGTTSNDISPDIYHEYPIDIQVTDNNILNPPVTEQFKVTVYSPTNDGKSLKTSAKWRKKLNQLSVSGRVIVPKNQRIKGQCKIDQTYNPKIAIANEDGKVLDWPLVKCNGRFFNTKPAPKLQLQDISCTVKAIFIGSAQLTDIRVKGNADPACKQKK